MGIIKAATGALGGVMADQWLEMFYCGSMPEGVLSQRGVKQINPELSSNTKGGAEIISDGSKIVVNDGQCALVVEMGKVLAVLDEPGENTYHSDKTGSIFSKGGLKSIAKQTVERIGYGGDTAIIQRVIYLDLKEHMNNRFDVSFPIRVKVNDTEYDADANVHLSGVFSFKITDPAVFYKNICKSSTGTVYTANVLPQLVAELKSAAAQALAKMCEDGVTASRLPEMTDSLCEEIKACMTEKWMSLRGFSVSSVALDGLNVFKSDLDTIQNVEYTKMLTDSEMASAALVGAQAKAMEAAASNPAGSVNGFVGMGAAKNMFLNNNSSADKLWICPDCGEYNTSNFCQGCGRARS